MLPQSIQYETPPPPPRAIRPRFGPAQLLIWITGIGAYVAIVRGLSPGAPAPLGAWLVLGLAMGVGTGWAGTTVVLLRTVLGARWPVEAGHWLLVLTGVVGWIDVGLQTLPQHVFARPGLVLDAASCWILVLPLFDRHLAARWRAFFLVMVLLYAAPLLLGCLAMLGAPKLAGHPRRIAALIFAKEPIATGSLLTTCLLDWRAGQRRDWLHWTGVVVFVWMTVLRLVALPVQST